MIDQISPKPITAIVVTYQSAQTINPMLNAARRCYEENLLDVIIVDNNSTDATPELLKCEENWVNLVLTKKNNGYGRSNNIGFTMVTSPYTIFINPDAVVEPQAIRTMMQFMEQHPKVGIVGPALVEGDAISGIELQVTGLRPTPLTILRRELPFLSSQSISWPIMPGTEPFRTGWVCGAVFMIRTDLMKRLNGFDPRFFLYWEEIDLCKRADEIGFETWALGSALAHHIGGASSILDNTRIGGCISKHYFQSRYYYMVKHHGWLKATIAEVGEAILLILRSILDVSQGRGLHRLRPRLQASLLSMPEEMK